MNARRERAIAHAALSRLWQPTDPVSGRVEYEDMLRTAFEHTKPRPRVSIETRRTLTVLAVAVGIILFVVLVAGSAPTTPRPYPQPTLTAPAVHR
jgi:hypothetical protein